MQIDLPTTLTGWVTLATIVGVGLSIVYFQFRNQTGKLLREQVGDMERRINFLENEVKRLTDENLTLDGSYKELKFKKNYLKQIIIEALAKKKDMGETLLKEISADVILKSVSVKK